MAVFLQASGRGRRSERGEAGPLYSLLPKHPPSGSQADHRKQRHYAEKLLAPRRIFGSLVDAVMAKFDEHVAVDCHQRQEYPTITSEERGISSCGVAERNKDAKHRQQSHACHQHSGRGLKMSFLLLECQFPVKDPPEGGKEESEKH